MLTITDSNANMFIEKRHDAVNLSQKLNATPYRNDWRNISEILYNWGMSISGAESYYVVSTEQLTYLKILLALPSW